MPVPRTRSGVCEFPNRKTGDTDEPEVGWGHCELASPMKCQGSTKVYWIHNFYYRFIQGFSSLTLPIQVLTHNGVMWNCSEQCEKAFVELKPKFTTAPILCHYHPEWKKQIQTDTSYLYKDSILSQYEPDRRWQPLLYYNKRFLPAELNCDVSNKEMVVIVNCFQK